MNFREFVQSDERQIDTVYQKAHVAVEIVHMYNPQLLNNIATIADLSTGAYGLYNSGENRKILPPETERALIGWGKIGRHNLDTLPNKLIKQYYPTLATVAKNADTIRINVRRIMREFSDDKSKILEISSTIIHEATHEVERETLGQTTEPSAYAAEAKFKMWAHSNWQQLVQRFPELNY